MSQYPISAKLFVHAAVHQHKLPWTVLRLSRWCTAALRGPWCGKYPAHVVKGGLGHQATLNSAMLCRLYVIHRCPQLKVLDFRKIKLKVTCNVKEPDTLVHWLHCITALFFSLLLFFSSSLEHPWGNLSGSCKPSLASALLWFPSVAAQVPKYRHWLHVEDGVDGSVIHSAQFPYVPNLAQK